MRSKYSENIVMYLGVGAVIIMFALIPRYISISLGADNFTANVTFILGVMLGTFFYISWIQLLQDLYSIITKKVFNRKELKQNEMEQEVVKKVNIIKKDNSQTLKKDNSEFQEKHPNVITDIEEIQKIRAQKIETQNIEQQKKEKIAIQYTKEKLALHVSDEDLIKLCEYIKLYYSKESFSNIKPVKVNTLTTLDIYHFGWNIWKHFSIGKQENIAHFLKHTFAELLKDVEVETIKKHLKDDELKGIIKIENPLILKN